MQKFESMQLAAELHAALADMEFVEPTPIQRAVLPVAMEGRDLMACAETGSGKTTQMFSPPRSLIPALLL